MVNNMSNLKKPMGCISDSSVNGDGTRATFMVGDIISIKHPTQPETVTAQLVQFDPCRFQFTARAINSTGELGPSFTVSANALLCYGRKLATNIQTHLPKDERTVIVHGDYLEDFEG